MKYTNQTFINRVAEHLLTQKKRAVKEDLSNGGESCVYRTPEGLKCAIGCTFKDDMYTTVLEGKSIYQIMFEGINHIFGILDEKDLNKIKSIKEMLGNVDLRLMRRAQVIHDIKQIEQWPEELRVLCLDNHLNVPQIVTDNI